MGKWVRLACVPLLIVELTTCSVKRTTFEGLPADASPLDDASPITDASEPTDTPTIDAPPALGTMDNPARTCAELRDAGLPSAAYWIRTESSSPPFQVYCEQLLEDGGWAMVLNSVRRDNGTTTAFWGFGYDDRLKEMGTLAADQNYYNGTLYLIGTEYMDVFVDLEDKAAVAVVMTATGFDPITMKFTTPMFTRGNMGVYQAQFAAGWSAQDFDGDPYEGDSTTPANCAVAFGNVAQHYGGCWAYNLGADSDPRSIDGGVGPHVSSPTLTSLGLASQLNGGTYSQVKRIARFTRW